MKRRALLDQLAKIARDRGEKLEFVREGGSHDLYRVGSTPIAVGRHADIPEMTARRILKNAKKP